MSVELVRDLRPIPLSIIKKQSPSIARLCEGGDTIEPLLMALQDRSEWTQSHSVRVGIIAHQIGMHVDLSNIARRELVRGALLHDIGKLHTPISILDKNGKLTDKEREIIERHPRDGFDIIRYMYPCAANMVVGHHEYEKKHPYPRTMVRFEDPSAVFVALADQTDALMSDRPYKVAYSPEKTRAILRENPYFGKQVIDVAIAARASLYEEFQL